jgi:hypothetical protein
MEEAVSESPSQVLARVDRDLRAYWSTPLSPGETPKTRACTKNLVVVAGTPELAGRWVPVIDDVLQNIPARAIVVGLDPDGADALEANSTAVCTRPEAGVAAVCSERVTLLARGALCTRLASCVDALCVPNLPMTLVWLGRVHVDDPAFAPLACDADRVILDAGSGSLASLAQVVRWAAGRAVAERPGVADLTWTQLGPWQELCARMFDEPRLRELSSRVTRIAIQQASTQGSALGSEGSLLLGWLATRLGWRATSLAGKLRLLRPQGAVRTQLLAQTTDQIPRNAIIALEIEASDGDIVIRGAIHREPCDREAAIWRLEVTGRGEPLRLEQRVRMGTNEPGRLLESTLRRPRYDEALAESASWADELRGEEVACG